jgi:hypothetical protein
MLAPTINYLRIIAREALNENDPWQFLVRFSPYHARFHMQTVRDIGFLVFHWCVIYYFTALRLDRLLRIMPYKIRDFAPGGIFYTGDAFCSTWLSRVPRARTIEDLLRYSWQIERCHNGWHTSIESVTRTPLMDPAINVYYPAFWNLHFFINTAFESQLYSYSNASRLPLRTPYQIIQYIDQRYPAIVGRI